MLVSGFLGYGVGFCPTAALSSEKLLHHTCLQSIPKLHSKVDYLQQLIGTEAGDCLFFLKSEEIQVPPPCLGFHCVKVVLLCPLFSCNLSSLFCRVSRSRTQVTPNNLVCLVLQFYFCMIDSWFCARFVS